MHTLVQCGVFRACKLYCLEASKVERKEAIWERSFGEELISKKPAITFPIRPLTRHLHIAYQPD